MSSIKVTHGDATVELEALDHIYADGVAVPRYIVSDVIQATLAVLRGLGTDVSRNWISALENAATSRGLAL